MLRTLAFFFSLGCLLTAAGCAENSAGGGAAPPDASVQAGAGLPPVSQAAIDLAQDAIIVDGHVDFPSRFAGANIDSIKNDGATNFDFARAMTGGFNAPFMSIYVSAHYQNNGTARERADELIDAMDGVVEEHPDKFQLALTPDDMREIVAAGKVAMAYGMENGAPVGDDLGALDYFHRRGIRYITLTHSRYNQISDSSYDLRRPWGGLSPFGEEVVRRMNALGILVDVSHISDDAFYDVMAVSTAPVIASHSGARHFTPGFERNMSDDMIKRLAENGGVIMINFGTHFLTRAGSARRLGRPDHYKRYLAERGLEDSPEVYKDFRVWFDKNVAVPYATVSDVADHIDYVRGLVGVEHVGLGSDFDGVGDTLPVGLKDVSDMPRLVDELMARGYSEAEIRKILGENVLRVWEAAERTAASEGEQ